MNNSSKPRRRRGGPIDVRPTNVVNVNGRPVVIPTSAQKSGQKNSGRLVVPGVLDDPAPPKPAAQGLFRESRAERVAQSKADGTFPEIRRKYNQENSHQRMNKKGDILPRKPAAPGTLPGGATGAPTAPPKTKEQLVAESKAAGTFDKIRDNFNASSKHQWMDDRGVTRVGPKITDDGKGGKALEAKYGTGSSTMGAAGTKVAGDAKLREETAAIKARHAKGIYGQEPGPSAEVAKTPPKVNGLPPDPGKLAQTISAKPADMMKLETPQITKPIASKAPPTALPANLDQLTPKGTGTIQQSPGMGMMGPPKFNDTRSHLAGANAETTQMDEARRKTRTA